MGGACSNTVAVDNNNNGASSPPPAAAAKKPQEAPKNNTTSATNDSGPKASNEVAATPPPKVYYSPTSSGAASYIAMVVGGITFDPVLVDLTTGTLPDGSDYEAVSWKGTVASIVLPDTGLLLSESVSTLVWANDNAVKKWGPAPGTPAHFEMIDNLSFVNNSVHKLLRTIAYPGPEDAKALAKEQLAQTIGWIIKFILKGKKFMGESVNVADVYLSVLLSAAGHMGIPLEEAASTYTQNVMSVDGVGSTMAAINTPGFVAPPRVVGATPPAATVASPSAQTTVSKPKVYYSPTSSGAASYIAMVVGGITFDPVLVDLTTGTLPDGSDYEAVSWKGTVASIVLPDTGLLLSESVSTLVWANDNAVKKWGPAPGTPAHFEMIDNLSFVNNSVHKLLRTIAYPGPEDAKALAKEQLAQTIGWIIKFILKGKKFMGESVNVADVYLSVLLSAAGHMGIPLEEAASTYTQNVMSVDGVGSTMAAINTPPSS